LKREMPTMPPLSASESSHRDNGKKRNITKMLRTRPVKPGEAVQTTWITPTTNYTKASYPKLLVRLYRQGSFILLVVGRSSPERRGLVSIGPRF
jgi:hypothetical protein